MAEWLGTALQKLLHRFDSGRRLACIGTGALSSGEERFLDAEEVTGSNPVAPTGQVPLCLLIYWQFGGKFL